MYRYGQYCPVARAAEIVADRWTVLKIRELLADVTRFNELERGLPHMSWSLLAERLRRLQRVGILERRAPEARQVERVSADSAPVQQPQYSADGTSSSAPSALQSVSYEETSLKPSDP
jgi:HxlR-like helix-turn-helix